MWYLQFKSYVTLRSRETSQSGCLNSCAFFVKHVVYLQHIYIFVVNKELTTLLC